MAKKLPKADVVLVGAGWGGGIIAAELTKAGLNVVGLERGKERKTEDYFMVHDELRYALRYELMQDLSKETITFRSNEKVRALPMRSYGSFLLGDGLGGAGVHWNGQTFRYLPYDFEMRTRTIERYGANKIPPEMTIQDWGITYDQLEPYFDTFEKLCGISGEPNPLGDQMGDEALQSVSNQTDEIITKHEDVCRCIHKARSAPLYDALGQFVRTVHEPGWRGQGRLSVLRLLRALWL